MCDAHIARVNGQIVREAGGGDEKVERTTTARLGPAGYDGRVPATVSSGDVGIGR
jgi:hypothetical protein